MVNGLHLYSAFTDPMATKALYFLPHIHSLTHWRRCQPYKAPSSCLLVCRQPTWTTEPLPPR